MSTINSNGTMTFGNALGGSVTIAPKNDTTKNYTVTIPDSDITVGRAMVLGTAVVTTSGTAIDLTGIPAWAKRITVMFNGVSTNGTSNLLIQIGSGSLTTSGYLSAHAFAGSSTTGYNTTNGFGFGTSSASPLIYGHLLITLFSGFTYLSSNTFGANGSSVFGGGGGNVTTTGVIDRVRLTTLNGTDTFDAGSINIMYEG